MTRRLHPPMRWPGEWREGQPPPWWPEGEPYERENWRRMRARFMRRMVSFAVAALIALTLFVALVAALVLAAFNAITGGGSPPLAFVIAGIVVLLLLINGGARGFRRIAGPLGDLVAAAERIEAGDYSARVRARGPREVRALGSAFNAMGARLEQSETERRRLLADVTHELRTPLTVIQGNIEALIDGVHPTDETHLRAILEDTHVLSRLVDDMRTISVAEAGALALHREPTDVVALARDTVASFEAGASAGGVALRVDAKTLPVASVDPIRLREIFSNIVANALRYTPRGGSITVTVSSRGDELAVAVRDSGEGIGPEVLPHVFERFTRADDSPGAGLGLAIAKSLVTAHGGTIEATSTLGEGTEIRFTLPLADRAAV
jgi:two-component system sensor histidine kinase BaeS